MYMCILLYTIISYITGIMEFSQPQGGPLKPLAHFFIAHVLPILAGIYYEYIYIYICVCVIYTLLYSLYTCGTYSSHVRHTVMYAVCICVFVCYALYTSILFLYSCILYYKMLYSYTGISTFGRFQEYAYLRESIFRFPTPAEFSGILTDKIGFGACEVYNVFQYVVYIYICKK